MLRSVLIAIAAALLIGAALTDKAEAQGWTCNYDFSTGQQGWYLGDGGTYSVNQWATTDRVLNGYYRREIDIRLSVSSTTITSVSASGTFSVGSFYNPPHATALIQLNGTNNVRLLNYPTVPTMPFTWNGSVSGVSNIRVLLVSSMGQSTWSGSASITFATLQGTGTAPCAATPTPTPVPPTATNTPLPTNTPPPTSTGVPYPTEGAFIGAAGDSYWGNTYNMTYGLQGWSLLSGTLGGGRVVSANVNGTQRLEMEYPLTGNVKVTDVFANYEASCAHTFEVKDGNTVFEAGSVGSGMQALVWQGEHVMSNGSLKISLVGGSGCDVSAFQLYEITIMGYGANPTNLEATAIAFEAGNLYSGLSDVNTLLESLPASINSGVPDETGRTLFGYAKWLISPSSADELAGPFAPIVSHTGIFVSLTFALVLVYAIVWAVVWIFRFVVWLFRIILQIIQVVVSVIGSIFKFFF